MSLKGMYLYTLQTAQGKFHGTTEEHDGKLVFKGTVATKAEKNEIWTAIKTIPTWQNDVKAGDTLSKIAKEHLGNASAYMKIFDLSKDQLTDPDQIKPGQVLRLA